MALYQFRNGIPLTTAAAANFTRGELATALRKVIWLHFLRSADFRVQGRQHACFAGGDLRVFVAFSERMLGFLHHLCFDAN